MGNAKSRLELRKPPPCQSSCLACTPNFAPEERCMLCSIIYFFWGERWLHSLIFLWCWLLKKLFSLFLIAQGSSTSEIRGFKRDSIVVSARILSRRYRYFHPSQFSE